jgi:hypothetical protein
MVLEGKNIFGHSFFGCLGNEKHLRNAVKVKARGYCGDRSKPYFKNATWSEEEYPALVRMKGGIAERYTQIPAWYEIAMMDAMILNYVKDNRGVKWDSLLNWCENLKLPVDSDMLFPYYGAEGGGIATIEHIEMIHYDQWGRPKPVDIKECA